MKTEETPTPPEGFMLGALSIGNPCGGRLPFEHTITIELTDESSRIQFLEIQISAEEMMRALLKQSSRPCFFQVRRFENVGKKHEHCTATVRVPSHSYKDREAAAKAALAEHELTKQGWFGYVSDCTNHHRNVGREGDVALQNVTFHRYV